MGANIFKFELTERKGKGARWVSRLQENPIGAVRHTINTVGALKLLPNIDDTIIGYKKAKQIKGSILQQRSKAY